MSRVLIAGGSTGIGLAVMNAFRDRGDAVFLADINAAAAESAATQSRPGRAGWMWCDLSTADGPGRAVETAAVALGGLDVVFGNAAVLHSAALEDWTVADWDRSLNTNLRAPFLLAQAAAPHLARSASASMIFTASTGAFRGHAGMPAYGASKAGLVNLIRCLADELAPEGIRVNGIAPGWVDTPFNDAFWNFQSDPDQAMKSLVAAIPLGHQADAGDLVGPVLFLASDEARYVTGTTLVVDGGYSAT